MEEIVKSILSKQGISLQKLSIRADIPFWTLWHARKGNLYLKTNQIKELNKLYKLPSLEVKPNGNILKNINNTNYISLYNILPEKSRNNFKLYSKNNNKKILIWYQPLTRGSTELLLPKYVLFDETFITGLGLSIGDGLNNPGIKNTHYNFSNTNLGLIKFNYDWLVNYFKLDKNKIQVYIVTPLKNKLNYQKQLVARLLKIDKNIIKIYKGYRHKKLVVVIQIGNAIFQCVYLNLFKKLKNNILNNKEYRISFLKGLFAAEGHVKHSRYNTIESISFAFNPKTEKELALFIKTCLEKDSINSKINEKGYLYICNYNNMLKFHSLGLIDLNKEKKDKFIRLCKNAKIHVHFKKGYVKKLIKTSQRKMADKLNICQPTISHYINKDFIKLNIAKIILNKKDLINNSKFIKVTNNVINNKENIDFMINNSY